MNHQASRSDPSIVSYNAVFDGFTKIKKRHSWNHCFLGKISVLPRVLSIGNHKIVRSHLDYANRITMLVRFDNAAVLIDDFDEFVNVMVKADSLKVMAKFQSALIIDA